MSGNNPKVSVIVPVYNTEKYLRRCLDSILTQTFTDWECLVIDDGSTDTSPAICDEYAAADTRFRVFHKQNGGVSSARNVGLENVRGEWVTFVDADDYITEHLIENLHNGTLGNVDLIISWTIRLISGKEEKEFYPARTITSEDISPLFADYDMHWHTSTWGKLFKTDIIKTENLSYDAKMSMGEDMIFLYQYILYSKTINVLSSADYYYYIDNYNSLTKKINSIDSEIYYYNETQQIIKSLIDHSHIENKKALHNLAWIDAFSIRRVLNSIYHKNLDREDRLSVLKLLSFTNYNRRNLSMDIKEFLGASLLHMKLYSLYDVIRTINNHNRQQ